VQVTRLGRVGPESRPSTDEFAVVPVEPDDDCLGLVEHLDVRSALALYSHRSSADVDLVDRIRPFVDRVLDSARPLVPAVEGVPPDAHTLRADRVRVRVAVRHVTETVRVQVDRYSSGVSTASRPRYAFFHLLHSNRMISITF
jgi:hypothetical protein